MADKDKDRVERMNEAVDKIHQKNQSPAARDKRAKKAAWWKRQAEGGS